MRGCRSLGCKERVEGTGNRVERRAQGADGRKQLAQPKADPPLAEAGSKQQTKSRVHSARRLAQSAFFHLTLFPVVLSPGLYCILPAAFCLLLSTLSPQSSLLSPTPYPLFFCKVVRKLYSFCFFQATLHISLFLFVIFLDA